VLLVLDLSLPLRYQARPLADGRVEVRGVPIFAETEATASRPRGFGEAWLARYTAKAAKRPGYEAPLHLHHTDTGRAESVGTWVPEGLRLRDVDGVPRWVLFATLRYRDRAAFETSKAYPHRSVEISPDHPDEINSLALLSSEAPYHRFPNLVTFRASRGESYDAMTDEKKPDEKAPAALAAKCESAPPPEKKPEDKPVAMAAELPMTGAPAGAASVEDRLAKIEATLAKLLGAEASEPAHEGESLATEVRTAEPVVAHAARTEGQAAKIAALEAKLAGQDAFAALSEKLGPLTQGTDGAKRLKGLKARIEAQGIPAAESYVEGLLETFSTSGARVEGVKLGAGSQASSEPAEVLAYAAAGPEKLGQAREKAAFHAVWRDKLGEGLRPLGRYLELEIGPAPKKG